MQYLSVLLDWVPHRKRSASQNVRQKIASAAYSSVTYGECRRWRKSCQRPSRCKRSWQCSHEGSSTLHLHPPPIAWRAPRRETLKPLPSLKSRLATNLFPFPASYLAPLPNSSLFEEHYSTDLCRWNHPQSHGNVDALTLRLLLQHTHSYIYFPNHYKQKWPKQSCHSHCQNEDQIWWRSLQRDLAPSDDCNKRIRM